MVRARCSDKPLMFYVGYIDQDRFTGLSADGKAWRLQGPEFCNVKATVINSVTAMFFPTVKRPHFSIP